MGEPKLNFDEIWNIRLDDLRFEQEIGKGAFGQVFRASYYGTTVAVKKIIFDPEDADIKKFLIREVQMLKGMRHPNIVQFIGLCPVSETEIQLVTEYVSQGNLRQILKDSSIKLNWRKTIKIASDITCAMAYLHSRNVIFRDLKSKNILVEDNWRCKVCDFGFARLQKPKSATLTPTYLTLCGTDDWMAPEVMLGLNYDESCDVFSYGIVLFELISRKNIKSELPRNAKDGFGLNIEKAKLIIPADCPDEFSQLAFLCCNYQPSKRPKFTNMLSGIVTLIKREEEKEEKQEREEEKKKSHKKHLPVKVTKEPKKEEKQETKQEIKQEDKKQEDKKEHKVEPKEEKVPNGDEKKREEINYI